MISFWDGSGTVERASLVLRLGTIFFRIVGCRVGFLPMLVPGSDLFQMHPMAMCLGSTRNHRFRGDLTLVDLLEEFGFWNWTD